tara:strand:- start:188 stop:448 length:261 start_codon:yes stop_codon:yes gene_type:complete
MIINAILKINPNAVVTVEGDNIDNCNIIWLEGTTPIPKADIEAMISTVETEIANAEADAIAKKASGKQKLKDLGLDDDEIKALTGA